MTWQPRRVCVNNDNFTLLVSGGGRCPWVSHALTQCGHHIQNDWANTATNLHQILREVEQSSAETVRMTQKATTRGAGDWQLHHNNTPAHASRLVQTFLVKHHITQVIQSLYSPYLGPVTSSFSQTTFTFEGKEISDHWWDSGKYDRAADNSWEKCMRCQGAYFEGDWGVIVLCTRYVVSCIFFNKCLYFLYSWLDTFWTDLVDILRKQRTKGTSMI